MWTSRPEIFGEVLPANGFYRPGDEIMLRWSEEMETFDPLLALNPDSIQMRAEQNVNHVLNSGGIQFTGNEFVGIPNSYSLDVAGWLASMNLWIESADSPNASAISSGGVLFCQGDHDLQPDLKFTDIPTSLSNTKVLVESCWTRTP